MSNSLSFIGVRRVGAWKSDDFWKPAISPTGILETPVRADLSLLAPPKLGLVYSRRDLVIVPGLKIHISQARWRQSSPLF